MTGHNSTILFFNKDNSGFITRGELKHSMTQYGMGDEVTTAEVLDDVDTNKECILVDSMQDMNKGTVETSKTQGLGLQCQLLITTKLIWLLGTIRTDSRQDKQRQLWPMIMKIITRSSALAAIDGVQFINRVLSSIVSADSEEIDCLWFQAEKKV
ncbi:EF-hand-like domain-containing protein [Cynara cardunculus var. scolymus]|uniref:EF-hand-like domain-containing protein n=1 Tax=Cynara cardunculus var. scolymus TaxID=59895 RepID=A0A103XXF8_CYNCS|nr:EF-hand-like domain-containing protein [Cynara cardunculus var. scolymus]